MSSAYYHLAQLNSGRILAPLDSPVMAGFVGQLASVNALADQSPGFVWRLATPEGDATALRPYADPFTLINMSVWESVEALKDFTYNGSHLAVFRDRANWFERPTQAHMAAWWIPAGHIPSVEEGVERLEFRRTHGDTAVAFGLVQPYPMPEAPSAEPVALVVSLDGRVFRLVANTPNGDVNGETRFMYRQRGSRVWATYEGGSVRFGSLVAAGTGEGSLDMRYHHVDAADRLRAGACRSHTETLSDGRLRLIEEWQWSTGDRSQGRSVVEEVR